MGRPLPPHSGNARKKTFFLADCLLCLWESLKFWFEILDHCKVNICLLLGLQCKPNSRQSRQCQTLLVVTKSYLPVSGDFVPDNLHHNRSHIIWLLQPVEGALRVAEPDKQHLYSVWWSRMRIQDLMKIWCIKDETLMIKDENPIQCQPSPCSLGAAAWII